MCRRVDDVSCEIKQAGLGSGSIEIEGREAASCGGRRKRERTRVLGRRDGSWVCEGEGGGWAVCCDVIRPYPKSGGWRWYGAVAVAVTVTVGSEPGLAVGAGWR